MTATGSGLSRILSASAASWVRIGITIVSQLALVPVYLSAWNADMYGAWLLYQATWSIITALDQGHQDFVGYECLRLASIDRKAVARVVSSALPVALLIGFIDVVIVWVLTHTGMATGWLGGNALILSQWQAAMLLQAVTWLFVGSANALLVKGVTPFGHYPRVAWWGTVSALATAIVPGFAVLAGADLWGASIALCASATACNLACLIDVLRLMRHEKLFTRPRLRQGLLQGVKAQWLTGRNASEMLRQQGTRLLLAPLSGVSQMAAFATMRTAANFALQGLNTISAPLMPELMRFIGLRDQQRMESAFAVIWLVLCAVLCPMVLVVQYFAPTLFPVWTHGKVVFDSSLFAMLSLSVLVFALSVPAQAVVQGNNLIRSQLSISILSGTLAVLGLVVLVPLWGIRGAAAALLLAEFFNLLAYLFVARAWLLSAAMRWPLYAFFAAASSVVVAALGVAAMAGLPDLSLESLGCALVLDALVTALYWKRLPEIARDRAAGLLIRFLPSAWRTTVYRTLSSAR